MRSPLPPCRPLTPCPSSPSQELETSRAAFESKLAAIEAAGRDITAKAGQLEVVRAQNAERAARFEVGGCGGAGGLAGAGASWVWWGSYAWRRSV